MEFNLYNSPMTRLWQIRKYINGTTHTDRANRKLYLNTVVVSISKVIRANKSKLKLFRSVNWNGCLTYGQKMNRKFKSIHFVISANSYLVFISHSVRDIYCDVMQTVRIFLWIPFYNEQVLCDFLTFDW